MEKEERNDERAVEGISVSCSGDTAEHVSVTTSLPSANASATSSLAVVDSKSNHPILSSLEKTVESKESSTTTVNLTFLATVATESDRERSSSKPTSPAISCTISKSNKTDCNVTPMELSKSSHDNRLKNTTSIEPSSSPQRMSIDNTIVRPSPREIAQKPREVKDEDSRPVDVAKAGDKRMSTKTKMPAETGPKPKQRKTKDNGSPSKGAQRCTVETPVIEVNLNAEWSMEEKKLLLSALENDKGKRYWNVIARKVKTKNVDQVKHYTEILRAHANDTTPIHLREANCPLQAWIAACERLIDGQDDVDAKCIPQVMTIAAVEPTSSSQESSFGPNYGRIYTFLSGILRGHATVGLSPIDAKVVLELLQSLEEKVSAANLSEQVDFLRTKYRNICSELEQEQIIFATEQLQGEIIMGEIEEARTRPKSCRTRNQETAPQPDGTATVSSSSVAITNTTTTSSNSNTNVQALGRTATRRKKRWRRKQSNATVQLSSLNPVNVPVPLLSMTNTK